LGIKPGTTTYNEVKQIVNSSKAFDKEYLQLFDDRISTLWSPGRSRAYPSGVTIWFEGELVKSISFHGTPYTVQEFIDLLGEPDEISISLALAPDAKFLHYFVFFASSKTLIEVYPTFQDTGPDPRDRVFDLLLNTEFNEETVPEGSGSIQPWLGYGHIEEYLPRIETPQSP
jgi:hypothetical protein